MRIWYNRVSHLALVGMQTWFNDFGKHNAMTWQFHSSGFPLEKVPTHCWETNKDAPSSTVVIVPEESMQMVIRIDWYAHKGTACSSNTDKLFLRIMPG